MITAFSYRKLISFLLLFILFNAYCHAQYPRLFTKLNGYISQSLENNFYTGLEAGVELFRWGHLSPEISYAYLAAQNEEINLTPEAPVLIDSRITQHLVGITAKLELRFDDGAVFAFPRYQFGKTQAAAFVDNLEENQNQLDAFRYEENAGFFSYGIGFEIYISDRFSLGGHLIYTDNNSGEALAQVPLESDFRKPPTMNLETLGFGFAVYYSPFERL
ncbi:hypothetical protein [Robertkochia aurantiaca]|uniref:hypothetical protein n=1 Tax=Robertkochia aurantiaca TaxID=2873700 RepID=UPI001CCF72DE|nr:hypothetical protein [Robertkochia sp. 3YJGBD-33]